MANGLHEAGARVVCHGLTARPVDFPAWASYLSCDLSPPEAPEQLVQRAFEAESGLDTLICNAGSFFDVPFLEMTATEWEKTISLNLRATFFLAQAFAKKRIALGGGGSIVIVSSTNGFQAEADSVAYDTSKGGLVMMIRSLAVSLAPHGIRVNAICPGLIKTKFSEALWQNEQWLNRFVKMAPLSRMGTVDEIAGLALLLLLQDLREWYQFLYFSIFSRKMIT